MVYLKGSKRRKEKLQREKAKLYAVALGCSKSRGPSTSAGFSNLSDDIFSLHLEGCGRGHK